MDRIWQGIGYIITSLVLVVGGFFLFTYGGLNGKILFMVLGGVVWLLAAAMLVQGVRVLIRKTEMK